jgi:hypothetical protein
LKASHLTRIFVRGRERERVFTSHDRERERERESFIEPGKLSKSSKKAPSKKSTPFPRKLYLQKFFTMVRGYFQ